MIIYSNEIANEVNKNFPDTTTSENISAGIVKYLSWIGPDIEVIDGDVVIWGKFKVDLKFSPFLKGSIGGVLR